MKILWQHKHAQPTGPRDSRAAASRPQPGRILSRTCAWSSRRSGLTTRQARTHPQAATTGPGPGDEQVSALTPPVSTYDVDLELWQVLDLCSDEELEVLHNILNGSSPFSPLLKSLATDKEPALMELRGRSGVMHRLEQRFRFLAADSMSFLRGKRPCYREILMQIRDRLEVSCSTNLSTPDLETEIFLHVLHNCIEFVQGEHDPDPSAAAAAVLMDEGDGMASMPNSRRPNWSERLAAPFKFGLRDLMPTAVKLGGAMTVSTVGRQTVEKLALQLVSQHIRYQAAVKGATTVARGAMARFQQQAALQAAQRGLTAATARYSAVQGALSFLGPVMWGWLAADLAMKAVGTDYARIIRAVYVLAQIRLVKTYGFVNPQPPAPASV